MIKLASGWAKGCACAALRLIAKPKTATKVTTTQPITALASLAGLTIGLKDVCFVCFMGIRLEFSGLLL